MIRPRAAVRSPRRSSQGRGATVQARWKILVAPSPVRSRMEFDQRLLRAERWDRRLRAAAALVAALAAVAVTTHF